MIENKNNLRKEFQTGNSQAKVSFDDLGRKSDELRNDKQIAVLANESIVMDNTSLDCVVMDFILSRQAMNCTQTTINWYRGRLTKIIEYFKSFGVLSPEMIDRKVIHAFLSDMVLEGAASSYVHGHARVIKTLLNFLLDEGYLTNAIEFTMPILIEKRQKVYTELEIQKILKACESYRDQAFIKLMVDSGLRLSEVLLLNWSDIDLNTGTVMIRKSKGRKFRIVIVGIDTRRSLLKYRSQLQCPDDTPVFQTVSGTRFTESGLRSWMRRLSKKCGVHITLHAFRRSFASFAAKEGMDLFHLQALMGHSSLEMTRRYVQLDEDDLITSHQKCGPLAHALKYPYKNKESQPDRVGTQLKW